MLAHEKTEHSNDSCADRFFENVDPSHRNREKASAAFSSDHPLAHVRQFDYPAGFMAPAPPFMPFSVVT
jgi:hypothetical protein